MKKIFAFCLLALAAVLSFGCSEETSEIPYFIGSEVGDSSFSMTTFGDETSPVQEVYDAIDDKLIELERQYNTQWTATVNGDDYSAADADAKTRFAALKSAYAKVESECNELLKQIEGDTANSFKISGRFYLQRYDTLLDEIDYSFVHND